MSDANALRQARHDLCLKLTRCPKCLAQPTQTCQEWIKLPPYSSHVYPANAMKDAIRRAGMSTGKTMVNTAKIIGAITGRFQACDRKYRDIGGLHKERWSALSDVEVISRLAEIDA